MESNLNKNVEWIVKAIVMLVPIILVIFLKDNVRNNDDGIVLISLVFLMGNIPLYVVLWKNSGNVSIEIFNRKFLKYGKIIIVFNLVCLSVILFFRANISILVTYGFLSIFILKLLENYSKNNTPNNFGTVYAIFIFIFNVEIVFYKDIVNSSYNFLAVLPYISSLEIASGSISLFPNLLFSIVVYLFLFLMSIMKNNL